MLRTVNPSPYTCMFDVCGVSVLGSSPQSLVK